MFQAGKNNSQLPLLNRYGNPNPITVIVLKSFSPAQGSHYTQVGGIAKILVRQRGMQLRKLSNDSDNDGEEKSESTTTAICLR